ncbi:hypothetical protein OC835_000686, partial [Tilletia horrida]
MDRNNRAHGEPLRDFDQAAYAQLGEVVVRAINSSGLFSVVRLTRAAGLSAVLDASDPSHTGPSHTSSGSAASLRGPELMAQSNMTAQPLANARVSDKEGSASKKSVVLGSTRTLVDEHRRLKADLNNKPGKENVRIKLSGNQITFLPERLIGQKVDFKDDDLFAMISQRACQISVRIPVEPGTPASIMKYIKDAFKENDPPTDLDKYNPEGIEFAKLSQGKLTRLGVGEDNITVEKLEAAYGNTMCVLVPKSEKIIDKDFHQFRVKTRRKEPEVITLDDTDSLSGASSIFVTKKEAGRPRPRPVPKRSLKAKPVRPASPVSHAGDVTELCFKCAAPFEPGPDDDGDFDGSWLDIAKDNHNKICPRRTKRSLIFASDSDTPGGPPMPHYVQLMDEDSIDDIHASFHSYLIQKAKAYAELYGRALPFWADENAEFNCSMPQCKKADHWQEMIQCEACPEERWFHLQCAKLVEKPDTRWRCMDCDKKNRPFLPPSPQNQSKAEGKKRALDSEVATPLAEGSKRQRLAAGIIIPRRSARGAGSSAASSSRS